MTFKALGKAAWRQLPCCTSDVKKRAGATDRFEEAEKSGIVSPQY